MYPAIPGQCHVKVRQDQVLPMGFMLMVSSAQEYLIWVISTERRNLYTGSSDTDFSHSLEMTEVTVFETSSCFFHKIKDFPKNQVVTPVVGLF